MDNPELEKSRLELEWSRLRVRRPELEWNRLELEWMMSWLQTYMKRRWKDAVV